MRNLIDITLSALNLTTSQENFFCQIDIIYKPVKRADEIINCYFSKKLSLPFCANFNEGKKLNIFQHSNVFFVHITTLEIFSKIAQDCRVTSIVLMHKIY